MDNLKDKHPMFLINITSKTFKDVMRKKQEAIGIPDGYRMILMILSRLDGAPQQDLAKRCCLSKPTVSLTLSNMEASGLIRRVVNEKDKRIINVYLTDSGREMNNNIIKLIKETEEEFLKDFSDKEKEELKNLLERILANAGFGF